MDLSFFNKSTSSLDTGVLVHNFLHEDSSQVSEIVLLQAGRSLVAAASEDDGWSEVGIDADGMQRIVRPAAGIYQYAKLPPQIPVPRLPPPAVKEWGAPPEPFEAFSLDELEEFDPTHVDLQTRDLSRVRKADALSTDGPPVTKRRRVYMEPLHNLLPQPHFYPSPPVLAPQTPLELPPYKRTQPIPIPPYTSVANSPDFSRRAWIIPIRGNLPWAICTAGSLLDPSESVPVPPDQDEDHNIVWTYGAVRSFWGYLTDNLRASCLFGPVGLSFHVAPKFAESSQHHRMFETQSDTVYAQVIPDVENSGMASGVLNSVPQSGIIPRAPLSNIDHIKIWHDSTFTMHVRNALHIWSFQPSNNNLPSSSNGKVTKYRMLKGAKLALVNEKSRGVLVS